LANRIAEKGFTVRFFAFEVGYRGLVGKSLRKFLMTMYASTDRVVVGSIQGTSEWPFSAAMLNSSCSLERTQHSFSIRYFTIL
jgi:hypothetical protein